MSRMIGFSNCWPTFCYYWGSAVRGKTRKSMVGLNAEIFLDDMLANLTEERDEARDWACRMMRERDEALEDARYFRGGLCRAEERERILWDNKESLITCLQEVIDKNWPRRFGTAFYELPQHLRDRIHIPGEP